MHDIDALRPVIQLTYVYYRLSMFIYFTISFRHFLTNIKYIAFHFLYQIAIIRHRYSQFSTDEISSVYIEHNYNISNTVEN